MPATRTSLPQRTALRRWLHRSQGSRRGWGGGPSLPRRRSRGSRRPAEDAAPAGSEDAPAPTVKADEAAAPVKVSSVCLPLPKPCTVLTVAGAPVVLIGEFKGSVPLDTHVKVDQLGLQFGRCQRSSAFMLLPQAPAAITVYRSRHKLNQVIKWPGKFDPSPICVSASAKTRFFLCAMEEKPCQIV